MRKSLLIVGAGFGQLPAIRAARSLGLEVIVVDKNKDAVGMNMADHSYTVDVVDAEKVLSVAKKHTVNGIMTMQSDLPVPAIGYVNDVLNLCGVSHEVANICSNKNETRIRLKEKKAAQPNFEIVSSLSEAFDAVKKIGFPCIIKAPDSSGSRGITKVNEDRDIENAYNEARKYSRQVAIIVEEFIDGIEFGAQTFSINGKCEMVLLHNDTMSSPPYMIPVGHSFPFIMLTDDETRQAIEDIKNAVNAVGITDGPANIDLILDENTRRVKVIEIGARIGATCLPELVFYHTGIDWVKQTILCAIGEEPDLTIKYNKSVAALILESPSDGIYAGFTFVDEEDRIKLLEFEITVKEGEEVNVLRKGTDRIGKVLCYGNSVEEAEDKLFTIKENILIKVD